MTSQIADAIIDLVRAEAQYAIRQREFEKSVAERRFPPIAVDLTVRDEAERRLRSMLEDFFPTMR